MLGSGTARLLLPVTEECCCVDTSRVGQGVDSSTEDAILGAGEVCRRKFWETVSDTSKVRTHAKKRGACMHEKCASVSVAASTYPPNVFTRFTLSGLSENVAYVNILIRVGTTGRVSADPGARIGGPLRNRVRDGGGQLQGPV